MIGNLIEDGSLRSRCFINGDVELFFIATSVGISGADDDFEGVVRRGRGDLAAGDANGVDQTTKARCGANVLTAEFKLYIPASEFGQIDGDGTEGGGSVVGSVAGDFLDDVAIDQDFDRIGCRVSASAWREVEG